MESSSSGGLIYELKQLNLHVLGEAVEQALFTIQDGPPFNRLYTIQTVYMFITIINEALLSRWPWSSLIHEYIGKLFAYISLHPTIYAKHSSIDSIMLICAIVYILVTWIVFLYILQGQLFGTPITRVSKIIGRFLLGTSLTMHLPLLNIVLRRVLCNYTTMYGDDDDGCDDGWMIYWISIIACASLFVFSLLSSITHNNYVDSHHIARRCHSQNEWYFTLTNFITTICFQLFSNYPNLTTFIFVVLHIIHLIVCAQLQPYYQSSTNHYRTCAHGIVAWTGVCLQITMLVNDRNDTISSSLYICCSIIVMMLCYTWSERVLYHLINQGLYQPINYELLSDVDMFTQLKETFVEGVTLSFQQQYEAALIEVKTRYLVGKRYRTIDNLDRAECTLRRGLLKYSQSLYLRVQLHMFYMAYRMNSGMAYYRYREFHVLPLTWDQNYALYQSRNHRMNGGRFKEQNNGKNGGGGGELTRDEVKHLVRNANRNHRKAKQALMRLWRRIASKQLTMNDLIQLVEKLHHSESIAYKTYQHLVLKLNNDVNVLKQYSDFLRVIKNNTFAAQRVETRIRLLESQVDDVDEEDGDDNDEDGDNKRKFKKKKRQSLKTGGEEGVCLLENDHKKDDEDDDHHIMLKRLRFRRSLLHFLHICLIVISIVCMIGIEYLGQNVQETMLNINDSAQRRSLAVQLAFHARSAHIGAMNGDDHLFEQSKLKLRQTAHSMWKIHRELRMNYATSFVDQMSFYLDPVIHVHVIRPSNDVDRTLVTGDDVVSFLLQYSLIVANTSHYTFTQFNHTTNDAFAFPELFYILQNAEVTGRAMDTSTTIYQLEAEERMKSLLIALCVAASILLLIEFIIVLIVFRPTIQSIYMSFKLHVGDILQLPSHAADIILSELKGSKRHHHTIAKPIRFEHNVDRQLHVMVEENDENEDACAVPLSATNLEEFAAAAAAAAELSDNDGGEDDAVLTNPIVNTAAATDETTNDGRIRTHIQRLSDPTIPRLNRSLDDGMMSMTKNTLKSTQASIGSGKSVSEYTTAGAGGGALSSSIQVAAAPTPTPRGDNEDDEEDMFAKKDELVLKTRERSITFMYTLCLTLFSALLLSLVIYIYTVHRASMSFASEINNAGRQSYLSNRAYYYGRDLFLNSGNPLSLRGSAIDALNATSTIQCRLLSSAQALLLVHNMLLYGANVWDEIPRAWNFTAFTYDHECSPFTWNPQLFDRSIDMKHTIINQPTISEQYFIPSCLAQLPWMHDKSAFSKDVRVAYHTQGFSWDKCILWNRNERSSMRLGLHHLILQRCKDAMAIGSSPVHATNSSMEWQRFLLNSEASDELELGISRIRLTYEKYVFGVLRDEMNACIGMISALLVLIFIQSVQLSRRLELLIAENRGIGDIVDRLLHQAASVMKNAQS